MNSERRCKCKVHIGGEKWHGSVSGANYHRCSCDACLSGRRNYFNSYNVGKRVMAEARECARDNCSVTFTPVHANSRYCSDDCREIVRRARYEAREIKPHSESRMVRRRRALWEAQGGLCALCKLPVAWEKAHLDHDHACCDTKTAQSCGNCDRGVLHPGCNTVLAVAGDDIAFLTKAIDYLIGASNAAEADTRSAA